MPATKTRTHLEAGGEGETIKGRERGAGPDGGETEGPRLEAEATGARARERWLPHRHALLSALRRRSPHSMLVAPARTQHTKRFVILILPCNI